MFEQLSGSSPLAADSIVAVARRLSDAIMTTSSLDDPGRIDTIRGLEELVCVATAAQAALSVELDQSQRAEQEAQGVRPAQQGRGVAAQVALARRESHHRGQRHLGLAKIAGGRAAAHLGGLAGRADHRVEGHLWSRARPPA